MIDSSQGKLTDMEDCTRYLLIYPGGGAVGRGKGLEVGSPKIKVAQDVLRHILVLGISETQRHIWNWKQEFLPELCRALSDYVT